MKHGALAVAIVQRQVMVVKAVRSHSARERLLDVSTFTPIGDRLFLATAVPNARISASDILTVFPFQSASPNPSAPPTITYNRSCDTLINEDDDGIMEQAVPPPSFTFEMLELPQDAFAEFLQLCLRNQKRHEQLWAGSGVAGRGCGAGVGAAANAAGSFKTRSKTLRFW